MALSFMKTGAAAHDEMAKADAAQQAAYEAASGPRRFWVEHGKEARGTFADGAVVDGLLQAVSWYEHMIAKGAGKKGFDHYPCTQETEACPICEGGDTPSLVFGLTLIDHREWKDKSGKVHQHERRLFVCKRETFKRLQAKAIKLMMPDEGLGGVKQLPKSVNGLVGVTFDITRIGDKAPAVGSDFDWVATTPLEQVWVGCGIVDPKEQVAFDYSEVIKYYPAVELRKLGFGNGFGNGNGNGNGKSGSIGSADVKALGGVDHSKVPAGGSPFSNASSNAGKFNPSKEL